MIADVEKTPQPWLWLETKIWFTQIHWVLNLTSCTFSFNIVLAKTWFWSERAHLEVEQDLSGFVLAQESPVSLLSTPDLGGLRLFLNTRSFHTTHSLSTSTNELWSTGGSVGLWYPLIFCRGFAVLKETKIGTPWFSAICTTLICLLSVGWVR